MLASPLLPTGPAAMRTLCALLLCCVSAAAQETFHDADFSFSMDIPAGMKLLSPLDMSAITGRAPADFEPTPRAKSPDGLALHDYRWRDTSGRNRDMSLTLKDIAPGETLPILEPDQFAASVETAFGIDVAPEARTFLQRGQIVVGMRLEADRTRADGAQVRQIWAFYPLGEGDRFAQLWMSALVADWEDYEPQFNAAINSVIFPLNDMARQQAEADRAKRRNPTTRKPGGDSDASDEEGWGGLQVGGSLLVVVILLGSLFFGAGKSTA